MTELRVAYWINDDDRTDGSNTNTISINAETQTLIYHSETEDATHWLRSTAEKQIHQWQARNGFPVGKVHIHKIWIP